MAKRNTKQKILDQALELFNEFGAPNVSTNHIADALEISPGNLYYHYSSRSDIIAGLFDQFEHAMLEAVVLPDQRLPDAEDIWFFLHLIFEVQVQYRFWYRDLNEMAGRHAGLKQRFQALLELQQQSISLLIGNLSEQGLLKTNPLQRATLARNILLVLNTWLGFSSISNDPLAQNPNLAVWQVISLVSAHMNSRYQSHLQRLAGMYLE